MTIIPSQEPYIEVQNKKVVYHFLPMRRYTADEVKSIRQTCRMTQHQFSELFGISVKTLESWEQGINTPGSAAARLLDILNYDYGFASVFCDQECVYEKDDVKAVRAKTGLPRELFALVLGVSENACGSWEQGRSKPNGPASRLLWLVENIDDMLELLMEVVG